VMTSVKKSPTNFLSHTDGIGPSVKLWNLVVKLKKNSIKKKDPKNDPSQPGLTCQTQDPGHETRITTKRENKTKI
jgi:hypothetical protein